jgi:disulfide bond formation protein DsbB
VRIENFIQRIKTDIFWIALVSSSLALLVVFFAEYIANLKPCSLCLLQRIPYFMLIVVALSANFFPKWNRIFRWIIVILFSIEIGLSIYHIGIEHYIFEESYVCQLINPALSCNQVFFRFMNLSIAEWNFIYAMASLYYFIYRCRKNGYFTR